MIPIDDICDVTKPVCSLTAQELYVLKSKLDAGLVICPNCKQWADRLFRVPARYGIYRHPIYLSEVLGVNAGVPTDACVNCIAAAADRRKKENLVRYEASAGRIQIPDHLISKIKKDSPGFVYVALRQDSLFKIGATRGSVKLRLTQQGGNKKYTIVDAIETHLPFYLEGYLHDKYSTRQRIVGSSRELFALGALDLEWIAAIQSVDGIPVKHHGASVS